MSFIESLSQVLSFERAPVPSLDILKRVASSRFDEVRTAVDGTTRVIDLSFPDNMPVSTFSSAEALKSLSEEAISAGNSPIVGLVSGELANPGLVSGLDNTNSYKQSILDAAEFPASFNGDYINFLQQDELEPEADATLSVRSDQVEFGQNQLDPVRISPTQLSQDIAPVQEIRSELDQDQIRARIASAYDQDLSVHDPVQATQVQDNQRAA